MTNQHTPTPSEAMALPWKCETELDREDYRVRNRSGHTVAHCSYKEHAAFIIRAVNAHDELLRQLKNAEDFIDGQYDEGDKPEITLAAIRRAIVKAESRL